MKEKRASPDFTEKIKNKITGWGANLIGIADVEPLKELKVDPPDLLEHFSRDISITLQLPVVAFEQITDRPTTIYKSIYQTANLILDQVLLTVNTRSGRGKNSKMGHERVGGRALKKRVHFTPYLLPYLGSPDANVRGLAAWIMGLLRAEEARPDLEQLTKDEAEVQLYIDRRLIKR